MRPGVVCGMGYEDTAQDPETLFSCMILYDIVLINSNFEKTALKEAIAAIAANPPGGNKLKGEFKDLRSLRYFADGQERRLIHKSGQNAIYLLSFGPREGIYKQDRAPGGH